MLHNLKGIGEETASPIGVMPVEEADQTRVHRVPALADETMLAYSLNATEVRAKLIRQTLAADAPQQKVVSEVQRGLETFDRWCLEKDPNWRNLAWCEAYRLDLLLALAEPADKLVTELETRLDEAAEEKVPSACRLRRTCDRTIALTVGPDGKRLPITPEVEATLRSQLVNVIEDTQWHLKKKYTSRIVQKQATYRIVVAAILSFLLFISPYVTMIVKYVLEGEKFSINNWVGLPLLTALTAGLFGAFFSRLLYIQSNWDILSLDELKTARETSSIILRGIVGMCGAAVVYFFLHSGLIAGDLFPDFSKINFSRFPPLDPKAPPPATDMALQLLLPNRPLALLVVWSFLAGFSERLVSSILATTETTLGQAYGGRQTNR